MTTSPSPPKSNVIDARRVFAAARMMADCKRVYQKGQKR